jgi:fused signal recognition particle receptor
MPIKFLKSGFQKIQQALAKTRNYFASKLKQFFSGPIDLQKLDELEQILYEADLGVVLAQELTQKLKQKLKANPLLTADQLLDGLKDELFRLFPPHDADEVLPLTPYVVLIVGVNGNGKTTTCAKLAKRYQTLGYHPILGAADTFRAAAVEQLELWAGRIHVDLVKGQPKSDPSAVAFDTLQAARARGKEVVLIDTAGRLHTKTPLMQELEKVRRACNKAIPGAPHATYLVLDATIGQNAIDQAKTFTQFTPISGLILTKLDGTAKGGIVLSIQKQLGIPVKFIGIGEGIEDLELFDPHSFINSMFS